MYTRDQTYVQLVGQLHSNTILPTVYNQKQTERTTHRCSYPLLTKYQHMLFRVYGYSQLMSVLSERYGVTVVLNNKLSDTHGYLSYTLHVITEYTPVWKVRFSQWYLTLSGVLVLLDLP